MKKNYLAILLIGAMATFCVIPAFAEEVSETTVAAERVKGTKKIQNEGNSKYLEQARTIKSQIDEIQKEIDSYKSYNESVKNSYKEAIKNYKEKKTTNISKENLEKAKELRKTIANKSEKEKSKRDKDVVKNLVNAENYDEAINKLNEILTNKKSQLEFHKNANAVWKQIEELIK